MPRANFTVSTRPPATEDPVPQRRRSHAERMGESAVRAPKATRQVAGCMTGTSLDGLDVALVAITGDGLSMRAELTAETSRPLGDLTAPLRALAEQQPMTAGAIAQVANDLAALHIDALKELKRGRSIDLICVHGQTVFHAPPLSWQLINPAPIAHALGAKVVYDLRAADLACGGQGAPLTPIADLILFGHTNERRTVVNFGGFCNLTRLSAGRDPAKITGADICACNQVLDAVARARLKSSYDRDGRAAMAGTVDDEACAELQALLRAQSKARRSLGTGDELTGWIDRHAELPPADAARTACAAIAAVIAEAARPAERLIVAGGGARNRGLMHELKSRAAVPVDLSDVHGVPTTLREAMAFAVLGALSQDRVAITLPQVTGVDRAPIAGSWVMP